jgi:hypothetical protein
LQRGFGLVGNVLREIPELEAFRADDRSAERLIHTGEKTQQRRLARTIRADEADAFAVVQYTAKTGEYLSRPVVTLEIGKPQQFHRTRSFARALLVAFADVVASVLAT